LVIVELKPRTGVYVLLSTQPVQNQFDLTDK
jgi:hypothetical protein